MRRRVSNYLTYLALAVPRAVALGPDVVLAMTDPPVAGIAGAFCAAFDVSACGFAMLFDGCDAGPASLFVGAGAVWAIDKAAAPLSTHANIKVLFTVPPPGTEFRLSE